ncbi:MAG: hypothetical protein EYC62_04500 [Alphaproteobacteria bacterium]|nr:MAG: hypothetical protein EYC62_04500 [Alphaproteobacteria bacterium]
MNSGSLTDTLTHARERLCKRIARLQKIGTALAITCGLSLFAVPIVGIAVGSAFKIPLMFDIAVMGFLSAPATWFAAAMIMRRQERLEQIERNMRPEMVMQRIREFIEGDEIKTIVSEPKSRTPAPDQATRFEISSLFRSRRR